MPPTAWMLELGVSGWQWFVDRDGEHAFVASGTFTENELDSQVEAIRVGAAEAGYGGQPVAVALQANWCLTVRLPIDRPGELRDRTTMGYRLEESIPWGAEDFVADYAAADGCALAVAIQRQPIVHFLEQLEQQAIQIHSVVPLALLAATAHLARGEWPERHAVSLRCGDQVDLVWVDKGCFIGWQSFSAMGSGLASELRQQAIESGQRISLVEYASAAQQDNQPVEFVERICHIEGAEHVDVRNLAFQAIRQVTRGELESPIEFHRHIVGRRCGNPALRKYNHAFQAAAAILLVCTLVALLLRGNAARRQALHITSQQAAVFQSVFPNAKVPVGIATRLRSELAKLQGLKGEDGTLPERTSAIVILERLLKSIPTDKRFRLLEIRMEEGRLYLDGETRVHSDAESIAQRLRGEGFSVTPPKSQRLDDQRVSLRITGTTEGGGKDPTRTK